MEELPDTWSGVRSSSFCFEYLKALFIQREDTDLYRPQEFGILLHLEGVEHKTM